MGHIAARLDPFCSTVAAPHRRPSTRIDPRPLAQTHLLLWIDYFFPLNSGTHRKPRPGRVSGIHVPLLTS